MQFLEQPTHPPSGSSLPPPPHELSRPGPIVTMATIGKMLRAALRKKLRRDIKVSSSSSLLLIVSCFSEYRFLIPSIFLQK
jgi:hypothetical protein